MMLCSQLNSTSVSRPLHRSCRPCTAAHHQRVWSSHAHRQQQPQPQQSRVAATQDDNGPIGGEDLSDIMKQDMERFAARQQAAAAAANSSSSMSSSANSRAGQQAEAAGGGGLKEVVDKVLIADFFFILAILAWLGVGLIEKATVGSSNLVDAWLPLWQWVFQPAIGVLMLGALVSGGLNWVAEQQQKKQ